MLIVFALVKESNRVLLIQERKIMFFTAAQDHIQSEFHTGWPAGPILDITGCDDRTQSSALRFKNIIFVRNVENSICLEGASKQNALFSKKCPPPKKRTHAFTAWNRPWRVWAPKKMSPKTKKLNRWH